MHSFTLTAPRLDSFSFIFTHVVHSRCDAMRFRTRGRARGFTSRDVERGEEGHR